MKCRKLKKLHVELFKVKKQRVKRRKQRRAQVQEIAPSTTCVLPIKNTNFFGPGKRRILVTVCAFWFLLFGKSVKSAVPTYSMPISPSYSLEHSVLDVSFAIFFFIIQKYFALFFLFLRYANYSVEKIPNCIATFFSISF